MRVNALLRLAAALLSAALLGSCATVRKAPELARPAPEPAPPAPGASAAEAVEAKVQAGDAAGAVAEFERVYGERPAPRDAVLYASLLRQAGRLDRARAVLGEVLAREPRNIDALYALALLEQIEGHDAEDRALLERILAIDPDQPDAAADLGDAKRLAGDRAGARDLFARALWRDPGQRTALLGLGRLAFDEGDFAAAELRCTEAITAHPDLSFAWFERARARMRLDNVAGALSDLDAGLRLEPDFTWALIDRGRLRLSEGRSEEALADFERAEKIDPSSFLAFAHAAGVHYQSGRWVQARDAFAAAVRLNPDYVDAYPLLGEIAWRLGDFAAAAQWYGRAYDRRPREPAYALLSALALKRAGRAPEAVTGLQKALPSIAEASWYRVTAEFLIRPDWDVPLLERIRTEKNEIAKKRMLFYLGMQYFLSGRRQAAATYLIDAASLEREDLPEKRLAAWEVEHAG